MLKQTLLSKPVHTARYIALYSPSFSLRRLRYDEETMGKKRQQRDEYREQQGKSVSEPGQAVQLPKKRLYRQRAHANPFSDHRLEYPINPEHMDWSVHFPAFIDPDPNRTNLAGARRCVKDVEVADIGCGFGGLLVALAPVMPDTLLLGMELRHNVTDYVIHRIRALRAQTPVPPPPAPSETDTPEPATCTAPTTEVEDNSTMPSRGTYQNISALRSNTMKFLPNFFTRHQLHSIFLCFPDPHFKARKHKARIVSESLNAEYAFVLRPGGKVYTITDVEELHQWMVGHFEEEEEEEQEQDGEGGGTGPATGTKELWERVGEEELAADPCVKVMMEETEEAKKVTRNNGRKFVAVWRRKEDPAWPSPPSSPNNREALT